MRRQRGDATGGAAVLLADRIPDARLIAFPGLGHLFFWEEPGTFASAVISFLLSPVDMPLNGQRRERPRVSRICQDNDPT